MKAKFNLLENCFASKFVLMLGLVFLSVSSAFAQQAFDKNSHLPFYFDGPEIVVGQENTLSLMLENHTGIASMELLIKLPFGVTFDSANASSKLVGNESRIPSTMFQLFIDPVNNIGFGDYNLYKITLFNANPNVGIKDSKDLKLADLKFYVSSQLLDQNNKSIEISEVYLSDLKGKLPFDKEYKGKTFKYSLAPRAAKLSFNAEKSSICAGDTIALTVAMENKLLIRDFEFRLSLPEGLTIPKDENGVYMFKHADRLPKAHIFSVNDTNPQDLKVIVSNMTGAHIEGYDKADLFSFSLVANDKYEISDSVVIKDVIFTDDYANTYEMVDSIGVLVANMTESYVKLQEALIQIQENKDSAVSQVNRNCPNIDTVWVKNQVSVLQSKIDSLSNKLVEIKKIYAFEKETSAFEEGVAKVQENIDSFITAADQLQAMFVANVEANKRLCEAITATQQNLDKVKSDVAKLCKDVAHNFDSLFVAIQQNIDSLSATVKKDYEAGKLTSESTIDTTTVNKEIVKVWNDAQDAQKEFDAEVAKKNANQIAYDRLKNAIAESSEKLDTAKADVAKNCKDVASEFDSAFAAIQQNLDSISADLKKSFEAVELTAESTVDTVSVNASIAEVVAAAKKAQTAVVAKRVANETAYTRLCKAIAESSEKLDTAKADVAKNCKDVASEFDSAFAAIQQNLDSISADLKKSFEAVELTAESTVDTVSVNAAIAEVVAAAEKAQTAVVAKRVANETAYTRLCKAVAESSEKLDTAKADVAKNCKDVASEFDSAFAAIQQNLDSISADLKKSFEAVELTAESTVDTVSVNAAIAEVLTNAKAAQKLFEADQAKKAANEAAYVRLTKDVAAVQNEFDKAVELINNDYSSVAAEFEVSEENIQKLIDGLTSEIKTKYEAIELNADSQIDVSEVRSAIKNLLNEAKKLFDAEEAKKAANESAYVRLTKAISEVQKELDDAITEIENDYPNVAEEFKSDEEKIQSAIDDLTEDVKAEYEAVLLNDNSKVEVYSIKYAISKLLLDAERAYIASGIDEIILDGSLKIEAVYTLDGKRVASPVKGWNIVKYCNGKVKKVYVK